VWFRQHIHFDIALNRIRRITRNARKYVVVLLSYFVQGQFSDPIGSGGQILLGRFFNPTEEGKRFAGSVTRYLGFFALGYVDLCG
jgi:hypothetical protein